MECTYDNEYQASQQFFQSTSVQNAHSIQLPDVRLQPSGNLVTPAVSVNNWTTSVTHTIVPVIPCDQRGQAFMVEKHKKFKTEIPANIYVGPYVLQDTVLSPDKLELGVSFLSYFLNFLVKNAPIAC